MATMVLTADGNFYARFFIEIERPVDEYLYDESGSIYTLGPYDTFEAYDSGSAPSSKGFGWDGNWRIQKRYDFSVVGVDFMGDYVSGSVVSGSDGNDAGWSGSYNVFNP